MSCLMLHIAPALFRMPAKQGHSWPTHAYGMQRRARVVRVQPVRHVVVVDAVADGAEVELRHVKVDQQPGAVDYHRHERPCPQLDFPVPNRAGYRHCFYETYKQ